MSDRWPLTCFNAPISRYGSSPLTMVLAGRYEINDAFEYSDVIRFNA